MMAHHPSPLNIPLTLRYILTLLVAGSGVGVGLWLHFPIPWMLGPLLTLTLASLYFSIRHRDNALSPPKSSTQSPTESPTQEPSSALTPPSTTPFTPFVPIPHHVLQYAIMMIGVFIGAKFEPSILSRLQVLFPLLTVLVLSMLILVPTLYSLLRVMGFTKNDALVSALPGAFSLLIAYMVKFDLPVKRITMIHSVRIIMILVITPLYFQNVINLAAAPLQVPLANPPIFQWILLFSVTLTLGFLANRFIPLHGSGFILTSLSATLLYALGYVTAPPPNWIFNLTLFVIAGSIASRLTAIQFRDLVRDFLIGTLVTCIMIALALFFAWLLYTLTDYHFLTGLLALIPGGIHEISLIAIIYNLDPVIIAFIHWVRLVCISVSFPFLMEWLVLREVRNHSPAAHK